MNRVRIHSLRPGCNVSPSYMYITANQRNGLETQAEALMTSVIQSDIRFTLELCNFISNIFQDFVFT